MITTSLRFLNRLNCKVLIFFLLLYLNVLGDDREHQKNTELILYLTPNNVMFSVDGGFPPIKFYKNIDGECCLYSLSESNNRGNKGIYNKDNLLFCNSLKQYTGKDHFSVGDTLIPVTAICDSSPNIALFSKEDYFEKQVKVKDYVLIMLCRYSVNFKNEYKSLNLIINPSLLEFNMIDSIESVANRMNYITNKTIGIYKRAEEWINYNYPYGDMIDSKENDSILRSHYNKLKKARYKQINEKIKCCDK